MLRSVKALGLVTILWLAAGNHSAFGFACIQTSSGRCTHWADGSATLTSFLDAGGPPPLLDNGTANWSQNAIGAADDWNGVGAAFHYTVGVGGQFNDPCGPRGASHVCPNTGPRGDNPVFFADTFCGAGFGDIIELTNNCYDPNTGDMLNAPVFVNSNVDWNAYDGPLRFPNGSVVYDIRRVLLHEFGHVLGLDHPDQHGQQVVAIMNSRVSNLDRLQPDDISGIRSLYPNGAPAPSGQAPTSGCQVDRRASRAEAWWMALLPAWMVVRRRTHGCPDCVAGSRPHDPDGFAFTGNNRLSAMPWPLTGPPQRRVLTRRAKQSKHPRN